MFLIWGAVQALYLFVEKITGWDKKPLSSPLIKRLKMFLTFLFISLGLLFFRLDNMGSVVQYLHGITLRSLRVYKGTTDLVLNTMVGLLILIIVDVLMDKKQFDDYVSSKRIGFRWTTYVVLSLLLILAGNFDPSAFLYYQF